MSTSSTFYIAAVLSLAWAVVWSFVGSDMPLASNTARVEDCIGAADGLPSAGSSTTGKLSILREGDSPSSREDTSSGGVKPPADVWKASGIRSPARTFEFHNNPMERQESSISSSSPRRSRQRAGGGSGAGSKLVPTRLPMPFHPEEAGLSVVEAAVGVAANERMVLVSRPRRARVGLEVIRGGGVATMWLTTAVMMARRRPLALPRDRR